MKDPHHADLDRRGWWQLAKVRGGTETDQHNYLVLVAWLIVWAVVFLLATWVLQEDMGLSTPVKWLLAVIPTAFAIIALFAYLRFLRMGNELLRRTQLDALALGCGAGVLFGIGYQLFEHVGAPSMQVSHIIIVMTCGWVAGLLLGMRRYW
jgi:phosphoglycerol transferase MdoB-like AlkP superfamily enzyme